MTSSRSRNLNEVLLQAALTYATGWGIRVFPITPGGKMPVIRSAHPEGDPQRGKCKGECGADGHGCHDGTTDPDRIRSWWRRWPRANIGISTGPESGVLVVDIDPRHDGFGSLAKLEAGQIGPLVTREAGTATGGVHLWFRYPAGEALGNTAGKLGPGLDTRGAGGFVVVPPSVRPEGTYVWHDGHQRIEPCPDWLVKLLQPEPAPTPIPPRLAAKLAGRNGDAYHPVVVAHQRDQGSRYQRQFEGVLTFLARQQEGNCSNALYWSACRLKEIADRGAPGGWVEQAKAALRETARRIGIPDRDIPKQIASGMKGGRSR